MYPVDEKRIKDAAEVLLEVVRGFFFTKFRQHVRYA